MAPVVPETPQTPRKGQGQGRPAPDSDGGKVIIALCNLLAGCESFKMDNAKMAPILGITHSGNAPRTVNRMVNPYGFQFKGGRIVKDGDANLGTAATPDGKDKGVDAGNGNGNENGNENGNHGENGMDGGDGTIDPSKIEKKQPATEARKGRGRPRKNPVAAKKRKLDVTEEEHVEDNGAVFQEGEV